MLVIKQENERTAIMHISDFGDGCYMKITADGNDNEKGTDDANEVLALALLIHEIGFNFNSVDEIPDSNIKIEINGSWFHNCMMMSDELKKLARNIEILSK